MKVLFLLCSFALSGILSFPGGVNVRVTRKALEYGASIGVKIMQQELRNMKIADIHKSQNIGIGDASYTVRLQVNGASVSGYSIRPLGGQNFRITVGAAAVSASGKVGARVQLKGVPVPYPCRVWPPKICTKWVRPPAIGVGLSASAYARVSLSTDFSIGVRYGRPTFNAYSVRVNIGTLSVNVRPTSAVAFPISALVNVIVPVTKAVLGKQINGWVGNLAKDQINKYLPEFFKGMKVTQDLNSFARVNYAFEKVTSSAHGQYGDVLIKGAFENKANPKSVNVAPTPFTITTQADRMLSIWISDYTINTLGKVYYDAGVLKLDIKADKVGLPNEIKAFLNTNGLAAFFPDLAKKYPNRPLVVRVQPYQSPTVHFSKDAGVINAYAQASFSVLKAGGGVEPVFWIKMAINGKGKFWVSQGARKVHAKVEGFNFEKTEVGGYKLGQHKLPLDSPVVRGITGVIIASANPILQNGFPLPAIPKISMRNERIRFIQNALRVDADLTVHL